MDGGEVLGRGGGEGAVELGQRARGGQRLGPLDQVAFEFAPQVALEAGQLVAVERRPLLAGVGPRRLGAGAEPEAAADPLDVDADHAGALLAAEGGDRQAGEVAQRVLVALLHRVADQLAQLLAVEAVGEVAARLGALVDLVVGGSLGDPLLDRGRLGGAEEVAVEEQLEGAPVVLGLGDRRRQRLAEVGLLGPGDVLQGGERVEDLRGPDRDALAPQLLAEAEQLRPEPGRAGVGLGTVGRGGGHRTDNRWVSSGGSVGGDAACGTRRGGRDEGDAVGAAAPLRRAGRRDGGALPRLPRWAGRDLHPRLPRRGAARSARRPRLDRQHPRPRARRDRPRRRPAGARRAALRAPAAGRWRSRRPRSATRCWRRSRGAPRCDPRRWPSSASR